MSDVSKVSEEGNNYVDIHGSHSDMSDRFEDDSDNIYIPDVTLGSPEMFKLTLKPRQGRMRNEINYDQHQSPSLCKNIDSTMSL